MLRHLAFTALAALAVAAQGHPGDEESLLETPARFEQAVRSRFGNDLRVLRLSLRADDADIEVQDAATPSHVDRYAFEEGRLAAPEPVQVGRNQRQLNARLFPFADVELSILPRLLADARERARTEEPRVVHVSIERVEGSGDTSSWGRPLIRVNVNGPRGGALVEYGLDGKHKGVTRW